MNTQQSPSKNQFLAVQKPWLQLSAGLVWSGVGVMLITFAAVWLAGVRDWTVVLFALAGLGLGGAIHHFGFSKLARSNIRRISAYSQERICLFAFQKWSSYPLVAFMIGLGIYLRRYSPIPKPDLAVLYLGIGAGLFASSTLYYRQLARQPLHTVSAVRETPGGSIHMKKGGSDVKE